jgi:hypothetical protein
MATRTYIADKPFFPLMVENPDWSFLADGGVPQMNAYIATTPKSRASVPFMSEKEDPVLAEWQYGMGHSIAFTSDFSGKWSGDWARWEKWPAFVSHMVTRTLPQYETEPYKISLDKKEGNTIVSLEAANGGGHTLPLETAVVSENGEQIATNTKLVAPGKYELSIPDSSGMYFLNVKQTDQTGNVHVYQTGFTVPYSEEYLLKGANKDLLKELVSVTGGKELSVEKDSFRPTASKNYLKQPISQWLILLAFLLFFVEITIRRFGTGRLFGWLMRRRVEPAGGTGRIERLPVRKRDVAKAESIIVTEEDPAIPPVQSKAKAKRPKPVEKTLTAEEKEERMRRLLEAKKRKS